MGGNSELRDGQWGIVSNIENFGKLILMNAEYLPLTGTFSFVRLRKGVETC